MLDQLCLDLIKLIALAGKESSSAYVGLQHVSAAFREYLIDNRDKFVDQLYVHEINGRCIYHNLFGEYTTDNWWLSEIWSLCGKLHRDHIDSKGNDLPAVIWANGHREWYRNGQLHRDRVDSKGDDLPAIIRANGYKAWYQNGQLHRDRIDSEGNDLPAIIWSDGSREWYQNGQLHRDRIDSEGNDLPAVICVNGDRAWYQNGQRHRDRVDSEGNDLPAIINRWGTVWYRNGKQYYPA